MRNVLISLMLLMSFTAHAVRPTQMVVYCGDLDAILSVVREYQEKLAWTGKEADDIAVTLWTNDVKNTYTIVKIKKDGLACAISSGQMLPKV